MESSENAPVMDVRDLNVFYRTEGGDVRAVDGVSFKVFKNEILGIVGESGCGKSTLSQAMVNLVKPPCYVKSGHVFFMGNNILELSGEEHRLLLLDKLSYIPQTSMSALNPCMRVREQIIDGIEAHKRLNKEDAAKTVDELLDMVGLPLEVGKMYPHELSGGMKQRATIAAALALSPALFIADEPTTALDVLVQRAVLEFIVSFKERFGSSVIFITHNIAVQAEVCDRIAVMYAGKIVELGPIEQVFKDARHPYTKALIQATPSIIRKKELIGLIGRPPSLINPPSGCRFASRCPSAATRCTKKEPKLAQINPGHQVACHI